jgi:hypothetical protein
MPPIEVSASFARANAAAPRPTHAIHLAKVKACCVGVSSNSARRHNTAFGRAVKVLSRSERRISRSALQVHFLVRRCPQDDASESGYDNPFMSAAGRPRQATILFYPEHGKRGGIWAILVPPLRTLIYRFNELSGATVLAWAQSTKPLKLAEQQRFVFRKFSPVDFNERHPTVQETCVIRPGRFFPQGFGRRKRRHATLPSSF